jgi:protoheme IX farnesyltransferase
MILARHGLPSPWLVLWTLVGGTLCAGGANAINQFLDRDIDERMRRTRLRPLPARRVPPSHALAFGVALGVLGFALLVSSVNLVSAVLSVGALLFYVLVYTAWLKRRSPQNIVIGGAAGAVPVLVGWAAVTGRVGLPAVIMFLVVFVWTPPHFWALAIVYRGDYAAAEVPMLPVVAGTAATTRAIERYTVLVLGASLALGVAGRLGLVYLGATLGLGGWFLAAVVRLRAAPSTAAAKAVFQRSITYLGLVFAAVAVDTVIRVRPL